VIRARVHPRYRTPHITTILTGVFVAAGAGLMNIGEVVALTNIGTLFAFVLVSVGIIILRFTDPDRPRPFRAPFFPFVPIGGVLSCIYLMIQLPRVTWVRFIVWLVVGLGLYFAYGFRHSKLREPR
ncbi:MAG: amino acid permease, partial [Acidimicrobiia bacterium]